jgi:hypothetical protein
MRSFLPHHRAERIEEIIVALQLGEAGDGADDEVVLAQSRAASRISCA